MKRFCTLSAQYGLNVTTEQYRLSGVRLIRTSDIKPDGTLADSDSDVYVGLRDSEGLLLEPGDLLFSRSGTLGRCLRFPILDSPCTFAAYLVRFRVSPGLDPRFVGYCSEAQFFSDQIGADAIQSTISNFNAEKYANIRLPWHDPDKQRAIADYLDTETTHIDALIEKKRRMIELLAQRRELQVSSVLWTRSLRRTRLKHLAGRPTSGNRDHGSFSPIEQGVPCLRGINIRPNRISRASLLNISEEDHLRHRPTELRSGDLVIVRSGATAGSAAIIPANLDRCNCVDLVIIRRCASLLPKYLEYVVTSREAQEQVRQATSGALLPHFNADDCAELLVPVRPIAEQESIVASLESEGVTYERLRATLESQISISAERRQSLITSAVTGELDVPGVAA